MNIEEQQEMVLPPSEKIAREIAHDKAFQQYQNRHSQEPRFALQVGKAITDNVSIDPNTLHGEMFVTPKAEKDSRLLAVTGSFTNLLGTIGVAPVIFYALSSVGILAIPLSAVSLFLLNSLQNAYTIAVARKAGNRTQRDWSGYLGIIGMQVLLSAVSMVGMIVLNSQSTIANHYANRLAEEKKATIASLKQEATTRTEYLETKRKCEQGKQQLLNPPPGERDRLIVETLGDYGTRVSQGVEATPGSLCGKWNALQQKVQSEFDAPLYAYHQALKEGNPALDALRVGFPSTYKAHFDERGSIQDGNMAIAQSVSYAVTQIATGNMSELGTALIFFSLSAITSTALVVGLVVHSRRDAIIVSFSDEVGRLVYRFFEYYTLETTTDEDALLLIERYQQYVNQGGVVTNPTLLAFVEMAGNAGVVKLTNFSPIHREQEETARVIQSLEDCIYNLRCLLHLFITVMKPDSYRTFTHVTINPDGVLSEELEDFPYTIAQKLRNLREIVRRVASLAQKKKKDVTALLERDREVAELLDPDEMKQQLFSVEHLNPPSFLHPRFESLDRLQTASRMLFA